MSCREHLGRTSIMNDTENENKTATEADLKALAEAYLDAFHKRDLDRCVDFFSDDASIDFNMTAYKGRQNIVEWHKDRFEADLKMLRLNNTSGPVGHITGFRLPVRRSRAGGNCARGSENGDQGSDRQAQQGAATDAGAVGEDIPEFHRAAGGEVLARLREDSQLPPITKR